MQGICEVFDEEETFSSFRKVSIEFRYLRSVLFYGIDERVEDCEEGIRLGKSRSSRRRWRVRRIEMLRGSRERRKKGGLSTSFFYFEIDTAVISIIAHCCPRRPVPEIIFKLGRSSPYSNDGEEPTFKRSIRVRREGRDDGSESEIDVWRMGEEVGEGFEKKSNEFSTRFDLVPPSSCRRSVISTSERRLFAKECRLSMVL